MIDVKYGGKINPCDILSYCDRLVGKVFKLLPLREAGESLFLNQHYSLMGELVAGENLMLNGGYYIELINKLEGLPSYEHTPFSNSVFSKKVIECIDCVKKIRDQVEVEMNGEGSS